MRGPGRPRLRTVARTARRVATSTPLDPAGVVGAAVAEWVATSPSLLPRTWWMWAVDDGLSMSAGYAIGVQAGRLRRLIRRHLAPDTPGPRRRMHWAAGLALAGITAYSWGRGARRQLEISGLVRTAPKNLATHAVGSAAGLGIAASGVLVVRGVSFTARLYRALLGRYLPPPAVGVGSALLTGATLALATDRLVRGSLLEMLVERGEKANLFMAPDLEAPTLPERSGSPDSYEPWELLGAAGRRIVAGGASREVIAGATGTAAITPIRVYAGKNSRRTLEEGVRAVLDELDRTGAWDRDVIALFTGTGTGWLQEWSLSAIEFLTGGNCATASFQYSVYSSALNYVLDRRTPQRAGRMLFRAVRSRLDAMDPARRPRLFVAGESLGSFGGQAAFDTPQDMLAGVDGAVWTGTPSFTPLHQALTDTRTPGSPQIAPVIEHGTHIRFVTRPEELTRSFHGIPFGPWHAPRIAYVQHASDPVVWWRPSLIHRRPDWLRERVGRDVTPAVRWAPWVTFWQLAADMPLSAEVTAGHGHSYHEEAVAVWAAVLGLDPTADRTPILEAIRSHALIA
jgi:uncharacterized membrane protein